MELLHVQKIVFFFFPWKQTKNQNTSVEPVIFLKSET